MNATDPAGNDPKPGPRHQKVTARPCAAIIALWVIGAVLTLGAVVWFAWFFVSWFIGGHT